jgi:hypothetical protein
MTRSSLPHLRRARVTFPRPVIADVEAAVRAELERARARFPAAGSRVAIGVGSRGIANIDRIVKTAVDLLRHWDLQPFIVPAMGSHGGATAEGQAALLAGYGVTEARMGCPVRSSMDVVELDRGNLPHGIYMDRLAHESDGVLLINRIKPHTDFHGRFESGLAKMAVIGLGKEPAASTMHGFGVPGLRDGVPRAAEHILAAGRIIGGLAIVENAYDETMALEFLGADEVLAREPALLEIARANMPALPMKALDILIVDALGKNISGTGLDTNVIGRIRIAGQPEPDSPRITAIVVCDLTDESHGNATGAGLADVITRRVFDKIDVGVTYKNVFTSGFPERGKIPLVAPTDADAFVCAWRICGPIPAEDLRVARIRDTLHLSDIGVSPAVARELEGRSDIAIDDEDGTALRT